MRRVLVFVAAALLCCSLPVGVSAEGFLPGVPSFGGWSCDPAYKADCAVAGKLGYMGYNRGLVFDMVSQGPEFISADTVGYNIPVEGLWVGASTAAGGRGPGSFSACDPGEGLCFILGASWLFPNNKDAIEHGQVETIVGYETWRPKTQWYTLDASVSRCSVQNFSLIGGFRYDSFSTKFADPSEIQNFNTNPADEAELTLTSYIPYVGAVTRWGGVQVGALGFPYVPGSVQWKRAYSDQAISVGAIGNYRNSYFLEAFADFGKQVQGLHIAAFATYTLLHATGNFDWSVAGPVPPGTGPSPTFTFGFDRQNWIVGAKAVVGFNSPL